MHDAPDITATASSIAQHLRVCVITSAYHASITDRLRNAAVEAFVQAGGCTEHLVHATAPGAWELGVLASAWARRDDIDGVVTLGCVVTGETTHDQWINHGLSSALAAVAIETHTPVGFGVLTCSSMEQAEARAGGDHGNKGRDTMLAVIETAHQLHTCRSKACRPQEYEV